VQALFGEFMSHPGITIGQLASRTSTNVPTIRYYEEIGLLPDAQRAANGHRYYVNADVTRLGFIKRCRDFGFPIEQVREMVKLFDNGDSPCVEIRDLANTQLELVRSRIGQLRQLEDKLMAFVASCDANCSTGKSRECNIIEDLCTVGSCETFREVRRI
jgi:DNA-binding transcriptional MerR regulator